MRARIVGLVFLLGLVAVGVATAGTNDQLEHASHRDGEVPRTRRRRSAGELQAVEGRVELEYKLIAANIENVLQAHIHMAPAGINGPIVAWLYPSAPPGTAHAGTVEWNARRGHDHRCESRRPARRSAAGVAPS